MPVAWIGRWGEWCECDFCSELFFDLYMIPMIRPNTSFAQKHLEAALDRYWVVH